MFDNAAICSPCKGSCCKMSPGAAFPEDFGLPGEEGEKRLRQLFSTGLFAIDWWEGDVRAIPVSDPDWRCETYFVRPAVKGHEGRKRHAAWGGRCTFLSPEGCILPSDERPKNCRMLEPIEGKNNCVLHEGAGKREAAIAWIPYTALLEAL